MRITSLIPPLPHSPLPYSNPQQLHHLFCCHQRQKRDKKVSLNKCMQIIKIQKRNYLSNSSSSYFSSFSLPPNLTTKTRQERWVSMHEIIMTKRISAYLLCVPSLPYPILSHEMGQTYQIWLHLQDWGMPVYGDDVYGINDCNQKLYNSQYYNISSKYSAGVVVKRWKWLRHHFYMHIDWNWIILSNQRLKQSLWRHYQVIWNEWQIIFGHKEGKNDRTCLRDNMMDESFFNTNDKN